MHSVKPLVRWIIHTCLSRARCRGFAEVLPIFDNTNQNSIRRHGNVMTCTFRSSGLTTYVMAGDEVLTL